MTIVTLERQAMEALRQIEPHSPSWVKIIRKYIRSLKDECKVSELCGRIDGASKANKYEHGDHGDYD